MLKIIKIKITLKTIEMKIIMIIDITIKIQMKIMKEIGKKGIEMIIYIIIEEIMKIIIIKKIDMMKNLIIIDITIILYKINIKMKKRI